MSAQPPGPVPRQNLNIAVLEDDAELRERILLPALGDFGFRVRGVGSAGELYRLMLGDRFDIVVLDIGLPDEDGISVARHLRANFTHLGLVMLTASHEREDRIRALNQSVDAFLFKPVDIEVLAATLHSLARRLYSAVPSSGDDIRDRHENWRLEAGGWRLVSPRGHIVALTAPEQSILATLARQAGQPVSREQLIAALTRNIYDFDPHRLDMLIHRLRRKVEKQTDEKPPLLTARGAGYVFAGSASTD